MNIINEFGYRQDGRRPNQIRNITYRMGIYAQADGSAYLEQGNTKVICSVYGPHECRYRSRMSEEACLINCQYSQTTFSVPDRRNRPRGDRRGKGYTRLLERAFESAIITTTYPRSQIDIFCEVIEADGGNLAACVNAASLALADAGIPLRGLVAAVECGSVTGTPCADMSSREHSEIVPRMTIATIAGKEDAVLVDMKNIIHRSHMKDLFKIGIDASAQVHSCLEVAVLNHVKTAHRIPTKNPTATDKESEA
jgi:exosome complex component RRP41